MKNIFYCFFCVVCCYFYFSSDVVFGQSSLYSEDLPSGVERKKDGNLYFWGRKCTDDCSEHMSGYDWAEINDITSWQECYQMGKDKSSSFLEGCLQGVKDNLDPDLRPGPNDEYFGPYNRYE